MADIRAIILAAGTSDRMQKNKLLLPYKGKTVLEIVIDNITQSNIENILIVTGAYKDDFSGLLAKLPVKQCYNKEYKKGMLSSVQCGVHNISDTPDAIMIFLADQPDIPGEICDLIIRKYIRSKKGIVIPKYQGHRGHPLLIDWKYKDKIENLNPLVGLRDLLHKYPEDIMDVPVEMPGILKDLDTPEDYMDLIKSN